MTVFEVVVVPAWAGANIPLPIPQIFCKSAGSPVQVISALSGAGGNERNAEAIKTERRRRLCGMAGWNP
ncbi:MAG: hypothetical protein EZS28_034656 [Streblomastix strix]|uniref:Uncharacterized protein n=1 Tax=Streblomastix strix TaxID=222440 RepID=A0A5J4UHC2_9EUKA|nr:MAG: hypothetical protein EZS28_034656 [Streblomastix strix]